MNNTNNQGEKEMAPMLKSSFVINAQEERGKNTT
jgi:hypothetical protein